MNKHQRKKSALVVLLFIVLVTTLFFWNAHDGFHLPTGNALVGTLTTIQTAQLATNCTLNLEQGMNLVALACYNESNTSLSHRVSDFNSALVSVHTYNNTDADDPWKAYAENLPTYVIVDLEEQIPTLGYYIYMNQTTVANLTGVRNVPTVFTVIEGWNLIGYKSVLTVNVSDAFASIDGQYSEVVFFNETIQEYQSFFYNSTTNFTAMIQDTGYWINITSNGSVIFV